MNFKKLSNLLIVTIIICVFATNLKSKVVVGYYPAWKSDTYTPSDIPMDKLTHINYSFGYPKKDGSGEIIFPPYKPELIDSAHSNNTKVILALGGWSDSEGFPPMAENPKARKKFIKGITDSCLKYNYDGIDLDWEFPKSEKDKKNLDTLVKELHTHWDTLDVDLHLSMAISSTNWRGKYIDLDYLEKYVEWFAVMTYDYGAWSNTCGYNSPLYTKSNPDGYVSVNYSIKKYYHDQRGVAYSKLLSGIPFYGKKFSGATQPFEEFSSAQTVSYQKIQTQYSDYEYNWDETAKVPYLSGDDNFITYNDTLACKKHIQYVKEKGLKGVIIWEITQDFMADGSQPLLETIHEEINEPVNIDLAKSPEPKKYKLFNNYPNPFNASTKIDFRLKKATKVQVNIYNIKGELVQSLIDGYKPAGFHSLSWNASELPSGVYFYKIKTNNFSAVKKCILIK